jgi:hypothetical protein
MARYDGPVCDRSGCTLITRSEPGSLSLRGEFNGWAETAMTAVPCRPGWFFAEVGPVPEGSDAWQYRLYRDGQWMDDRDNRWIRFADLAVNQAMYRPGVPRLARLAAVHSPQLGNDRDVYVFVPAEAFEDPQRRFPLMLLQDGWNVFDNPRAPYGSWNVDRTARTLAAQGAIEPVILAGIALTAALGGLDRLVFTGGIGANASEIRARICDGLAYLGITLEPKINLAGVKTISPSGAAVTVQAVHSDEEVMIARHVIGLCARQPAQAEA